MRCTNEAAASGALSIRERSAFGDSVRWAFVSQPLALAWPVSFVLLIVANHHSLRRGLVRRTNDSRVVGRAKAFSNSSPLMRERR